MCSFRFCRGPLLVACALVAALPLAGCRKRTPPAPPPSARAQVPKLAVSVLPDTVRLPTEVLVAINVAEAGRFWLTTTAGATLGPRLVTVTQKVKLLPVTMPRLVT